MDRLATVGRDAALALGAGVLLGWGAPALAAPVSDARLSADLDGARVVPGPGDPDGRGSFRGTLTGKTRELCYELELRGIGPLTGVRIHIGRPGRADMAVQQLVPPDHSGKVGTCVKLDRELAHDLIRMPVLFYIEATTEDFPAGAVRGQLSKPGMEE